VHTADHLVNNYQGYSGTVPYLSSLDPAAKRVLFRQVETISDWFPNIANEIDSACEFFLTGA